MFGWLNYNESINLVFKNYIFKCEKTKLFKLNVKLSFMFRLLASTKLEEQVIINVTG